MCIREGKRFHHPWKFPLLFYVDLLVLPSPTSQKGIILEVSLGPLTIFEEEGFEMFITSYQGHMFKWMLIKSILGGWAWKSLWFLFYVLCPGCPILKEKNNAFIVRVRVSLLRGRQHIWRKHAFSCGEAITYFQTWTKSINVRSP